MTYVELLDLDPLPEHLIVIGGGYVGLELAQAIRRFGARVTVIEQGQQLAGREDADVGTAILELFRDEGIAVYFRTQIRSVEGESGSGPGRLQSVRGHQPWHRIPPAASADGRCPDGDDRPRPVHGTAQCDLRPLGGS
jgi:pyruvate/2-oxoglutarate dehydrogenase complex dihydrolipoamide dehydrogenase (E3) component